MAWVHFSPALYKYDIDFIIRFSSEAVMKSPPQGYQKKTYGSMWIRMANHLTFSQATAMIWILAQDSHVIPFHHLQGGTMIKTALCMLITWSYLILAVNAQELKDQKPFRITSPRVDKTEIPPAPTSLLFPRQQIKRDFAKVGLVTIEIEEKTTILPGALRSHPHYKFRLAKQLFQTERSDTIVAPIFRLPRVRSGVDFKKSIEQHGWRAGANVTLRSKPKRDDGKVDNSKNRYGMFCKKKNIKCGK